MRHGPPSLEVLEALSADGFERLLLLGRGVDTELFDPARRSRQLRWRWTAGDDDPVVLYVGRLATEKNIESAVRVFREVQAAVPRARFVLVGDGPARPQLETRHPELVFCGLRRGEELAACYASGDLFLFLGLTETFGNAVLEAMTSGLAVVAYDRAAARMHLMDGESGALAPSGDESELTRRAVAVAREPRRRRELESATRRVAEALGWGPVVDALECRLLLLAASSRTHGEVTGRSPVISGRWTLSAKRRMVNAREHRVPVTGAATNEEPEPFLK